MTRRILPHLLLLLAALILRPAAAADHPITATQPPDHALGRDVSYLQETDGQLTLAQAISAYDRGDFTAGSSPVLNFGIGARPVWIHFAVNNDSAKTLPRRLSIETAWLDQIDVYIRHGGHTVATYHLGDTEPFKQRPVDSRLFAADHAFAPGVTEVFLRVQTPDPMVVPIYLLTPDQAHTREQIEDYSYGFLYGFLFALLAYNVMLYLGLRDARYVLYAVYLGMFLLMNISYTGHGFRWFWPMDTGWAQWSNPILMVLYGVSGLVFAMTFLNTRRHFPRLHKAVLAFLGAACALLLLAALVGNQRSALLIAFTFVSLFTVVMLAMGMVAVRSGQKPAQYFLLAAISAMVGAAVTALTVWGFIPFSTWTFRAVDVGVLLDATLLALALTYQYRITQEGKFRAEQLATLDPLTGINNRRAFYDNTRPIWNIMLRHNHTLSVILMDLDRFKHINDVHGHAGGDAVLVATARVLSNSIREQDIMARWGGEEFIMLLPETDLRAAAALAERLRLAIEDLRVTHAGAEIRLTASFGVAQRAMHHHNLDALISMADKHLYHAKDAGRNRVSCVEAAPAG